MDEWLPWQPPEGWSHNGNVLTSEGARSGIFLSQPVTDVAWRMWVQPSEGQRFVNVYLRQRGNAAYIASVSPSSGAVQFFFTSGEQREELDSASLDPQRLKNGFELVVASVGDQLAMFVDGDKVVEASDDRLKSGWSNLGGVPGPLERVMVQRIGETPHPRPLELSDLSSGSWRPLDEVAAPTEFEANQDRGGSSLGERSGIKTGQGKFVTEELIPDVAIRARVRPNESAKEAWITLRHGQNRNDYAAVFRPDAIYLRRSDEHEALAQAPFTPQGFRDFEAVFAAIGDRLALFVDGQRVVELQDDSAQQGGQSPCTPGKGRLSFRTCAYAHSAR